MNAPKNKPGADDPHGGPPSKSRTALWAFLILSLIANVWLARALLFSAVAASNSGKAGLVPSGAEESSVQATEEFHWSMVQSADYSRYLENLRVISCPAETATNLIAGVAMDDYSAAMWDAGRPLRENFWRFRSNPEDQDAVLARESMSKLEAETSALGNRMFPGRFDEADSTHPLSLNDLYGQADVDFLSGEKQKAAGSIVHEDFQRHIVWSGSVALIPPDGMGQWPWYWQPTNEASIRRSLLEVLNPEEEQEFEVRHSSPATRIRQSLYGFAASPEELRAIAKVMLDADKESAFLEHDIKKYEAIEDEHLKDYLGEERFAEFKRGLEPGFRKFALLAECYDAPAGSAAEMYQIEQQTAATARELLADPKATEAEKRGALDDLREGLRSKMRGLFGARALETYELNGGFALPKLTDK